MRALEHRLTIPEGTDPELARAILAGRYALPKVPDMPKAHRILDLGAGVGAFCAWSFYLWPHAWIDAYERNEARAAYCQQNAPPGTKVHAEHVTDDVVDELPPAQVLRIHGDIDVTHYRHWAGVHVLVHEWRGEEDRHFVERLACDFGLRLVACGVDHLERGFNVWVRTNAHYDDASDVHYVIGDDGHLDDEAPRIDPSFALALTNTPWVPARRESFSRLLAALGCAAVDDALHIHDHRAAATLAGARIFNEREPNHAWSRKMWTWALEQSNATHALFLQDDVWPAPNFWPALRALVMAAPNEIIGLEAAHPAGPALAAYGERWYATRAWLIGPGYVFPREALGELLAWRARQPRMRILATNEDTLINEWCVETGRRVLHPIPTIIDHDTSIASTYENDADAHRRPTVKWTDGKGCGFALEDLEDVKFWLATGVTRLALPEVAK